MVEHTETTRRQKLNPFRPNPRKREKIKSNFFFHTSLWCLKKFYEGLKDFKSLKAFIKHFEAPQRSVKIKIQLNFYFNKTFRNSRGGKGK